MNIIISYVFILLTFLSCGDNSNDLASRLRLPQSEEITLDIILDRSDVIWGFEFLPDGRIIFTEREGSILIFNSVTNEVNSLQGVPTIAAGGEGGLLDLRLHPNFRSNNQIFFCYTETATGGRTQALARAELQGSTLVNVQKLFSAGNANTAPNHFGCRIEFTTNNQLFLSLGDQADAELAQNPSAFQGKILRMNTDGTGVEIFSFGHRNPQGLATHPSTGELFSSEHGPSGGDELNIIARGSNYGWPLVTLGEPAGPLGRSSPGFVDPIASWPSSIAPSGIHFYSGNQIPAWQGNLFIATLRGEHILRLTIADAQVTGEEILFENEDLRFRTLRTGLDGYLYFSTDDGKIGRIIEAQ